MQIKNKTSKKEININKTKLKIKKIRLYFKMENGKENYFYMSKQIFHRLYTSYLSTYICMYVPKVLISVY